MSTFYSFINSLMQLVWITDPKSILEFGPGFSTNIFLQYTSARITSYETNKTWFDIYRGRFINNKLDLIYKNPDWDLSELSGIYDLIFIDGGDRNNILIKSLNLIDKSGFVFLHDAHREEYEEGLKSFPLLYFPEKHSCILSKNREALIKISNNIKADLSCSCDYCSSENRKKYFERIKGEKGIII